MIKDQGNTLRRRNYDSKEDPDFWFLLYALKHYFEFLGEDEIAQSIADEAELDKIMITKEEIERLDETELKNKFTKFVQKNLFSEKKESFLENFWGVFYIKFIENQRIINR